MHFICCFILSGFLLCATILPLQAGPPLIASGLPAEGPLEPFVGASLMEKQTVFASQRFPSVVVTVDGTVLAVFGQNSCKARRSTDGGVTWGPAIDIGPGISGGGTIVNETTGEILAFVESAHPPAPLTVYSSTDDGLTWSVKEVTIAPDVNGRIPSMHMNESGITLRHGAHAGRLIRPTRSYAGGNGQEHWNDHYTNAMFSDDGGLTWATSHPFPAYGTGEAALAELSDGTIYYNSRRHRSTDGLNPRMRHIAWSGDGGMTWEDLSVSPVLPDGDQDRDYGLMGGLVRLPVAGRDILVYSNIESPSGRHHGTVWISLDGGRTWPVKRLVDAGSFAYSALAAGRPGTASEGWIYLHYESGSGSRIARFNLSWVLEGALTGDGTLFEENPGAALWNFEETPPGASTSTAPGAIHDVHPSSRRLHLTASEPILSTDGSPDFGAGRALSFAGASLLLPDADSQNRFDYGPQHSFTIEIVCRTGFAQTAALVTKDAAPGTPAWSLSLENGKPRFHLTDGEEHGIVLADSPLGDGQWQHLALVRDASDPDDKQLRLYLDGVPAANAADPTTATLANAAALRIARLNSGDHPFTGDIDFVRVTPAALAPEDFADAATQAAVFTLVDVDFGHLIPGEPIHDGTLIRDVSGLGHHGFWAGGSAANHTPVIAAPDGPPAIDTSAKAAKILLRPGLGGIPEAWDGPATTVSPYFIIDGSQSHTFEAVLNWNGSTSAVNGIMGLTGSNEFWMREQNGFLLYAFASGGTNANLFSNTINISVARNSGGWHVITVVYDAPAGEIRSYLDGVRLHTHTDPDIGALGTLFGGSGDFSLGGYNNTTTSHFNGLQKRYRITRGSLSPAEFLQLPAAPGTAYAEWIGSFFPGETNSAIVSPEADPSGRGIPNGILFVIGGDPSPGSAPAPDKLPSILRPGDPDHDPDSLTFVFRRTHASIPFAPHVQYGPDLADWTDARHGEDGVTITEDENFHAPGIDRVRVKIPHVGRSRLFARLSIGIP